MDLIPILSSLSTGVPWLDHTLRVIGIVYVLYSVFLNILVSAYPEAAKQQWVLVSLAVVANINSLLRKPEKGQVTFSITPPPADLRAYLQVVPPPKKTLGEQPTLPAVPATPSATADKADKADKGAS